MHKNKIKVVVCGHDQKFWNPIQKELYKSGHFEFREDLWRGHDEHSVEQSQQCVEWADVIMAEWTMGNAVWYSKNKKNHQKLITRLHLQERNTPFPGKLEIDNVDKIVFVGKHILREVVEKFNIPLNKTCVVSNYVDYKRYDQPKNADICFNLGILGVVPMRKRLDLAVDLLGRLLKSDDRYCLHIKGPRPDSYGWLWTRTAERDYYLDLWSRIKSTPYANRVIFHPAGDDVQDWFKKIGFLLSPSDFESFHMAIPEGMCSGTIPVIWDWEGAADIYRLVQPVKNLEQAEDWILKMTGSTTSWYMGQQAKIYAKRNFDIETTVGQWLELLTSPINDHSEKIDGRSESRQILVFWLISNWENFHRREMIEALAENLKGRVEILVIEPGEDSGELIRRGWESQDSLDQYSRNQPVEVGSNIHKFRIVTSSTVRKIGKAIGTDRYGQSKSNSRLRNLVDTFYGEGSKILHWIYKPNQIERLLHGKNNRFIYEVYDDYTRNFETGELNYSVQEMEENICGSAQHVFFTAKTLEERKSGACKSFSTVSNGVNYNIFATYRVDNVAPNMMALRKSVGYMGNLSDFFDWNLMLQVVRGLPHIDFYFHGKIEHHKLKHKQAIIEELRSLPNSVFTGLVTREQGAAAIARYSVLIIPFVKNEAMDAVNPLKLWEYFAVGKPVISSKMHATEHLIGMLHFADDVNDWIQKIEELANSEIDESVRTNQIDLARQHSWSELTIDHAQVVKKHFELVQND